MGMNEGQEGWDGCGLVYLKYFLGRSSVVVADSQSRRCCASMEKKSARVARYKNRAGPNSSGLILEGGPPAQACRTVGIQGCQVPIPVPVPAPVCACAAASCVPNQGCRVGGLCGA